MLTCCVAFALATGVAWAEIFGTDGPDTLTGTPGADSFYARGGDDTINGLGGNDDIDGGAGGDDLRGGAGVDAVSYSGSTVGVTVTLDETANDGAQGEGDNVHNDIEAFYGSGFSDSFTGDSSAETLDGGGGDDRLDGGRGTDAYFGGAGNDTIDAQDGRAETVDCGEGTDTAIIDANDRRRNCEQEEAPGARRARASTNVFFVGRRTFTSVVQLNLVDVEPSTARVNVRCSGGGCPFRTRRFALPENSSTVRLTSAFRRRRLRVGATIEIRITAPSRTGQYIRYTMRRSRSPARQTRCLAPGSTRPVDCPRRSSAGRAR